VRVLKASCALLTLMGLSMPLLAQQPIPGGAAATGRHLSVRDRVGDLLEHPAFRGHGRLLLPWDDRPYDTEMPLASIGSLLPYHTQVDPQVVVHALNRMIDHVNAGKTVFFEFYTDAQKRADPTKRNTGLFFYRGKPRAPFALIAPGGGFFYVGSVHEGFPYATEISNRGHNAFVVKYRVGQGQTAATQDMAAALSYVFRHADALGITTEDYSLWGSSAGARMAAAVGSHGAASFGGDPLPKPSAVVMAYTSHSDYTASEPPTFVVVGARDGIAPPASMERRIAALRSAGTAVEYRKYSDLGHGFGPGTGTSAGGWIAEATTFWERHRRGGSNPPRPTKQSEGLARCQPLVHEPACVAAQTRRRDWGSMTANIPSEPSP
jgi:acetyl esterase/lipase